MQNTRKAIAKIEETLGTEIEAAAAKRDLNKMVLALTDSLKNLVVISKEMADAIEAVHTASNPAKAAPKKAAKPKKPAVKRTQKTPIKPG
jgi:hypothetical protein